MGSQLQKILNCLALAVDGEVYDTIVADIQRAVSAEIETAIAPWREGERIALERVDELEGALESEEDRHESTKLILRVAQQEIKNRNQLLSRTSLCVKDAEVLAEIERLVPQPKVEPKGALNREEKL